MASNVDASGLKLFKRPQPFRSKRQRTYIIPTGFGLAFGTMAFVLFIMAVGYANNLIYIFVFFLISVAFTGMLITNRNIHVLSFRNLAIADVFAGEGSLLHLDVANETKTPAWEIVAYLGKAPLSAKPTRVAPQATTEILLPVVFEKRGLQTIHKVSIQSTFPFGLLRAWKHFTTKKELLVFPQRKGDTDFPISSFAQEDLQNTGLFRDHREFQPTDTLSRIDWKASARRQSLYVKNFEEPSKPRLNFDWSQTQHLTHTEDRLSQLCLWIDKAEKLGHPYSLTINKIILPLDKGPAHWRRCLSTLAEFKGGDTHE